MTNYTPTEKLRLSYQRDKAVIECEKRKKLDKHKKIVKLSDKKTIIIPNDKSKLTDEEIEVKYHRIINVVTPNNYRDFNKRL